MNVDKMRHQLERDHRERPVYLTDATGYFTIKGGRHGRLVGDVQRTCWPAPAMLRVQVQVGATGGVCVFPTIDGGLTVGPGETVNLHREDGRWIVDGKVAQ